VCCFVVQKNKYDSHNRRAAKNTRIRLAILVEHVKLRKMETGRYPPANHWISELSPYLEGQDVWSQDTLFFDGWGQEFRLSYVAKDDDCPLVYSIGENAVDEFGMGDDISIKINTDY